VVPETAPRPPAPAQAQAPVRQLLDAGENPIEVEIEHSVPVICNRRSVEPLKPLENEAAGTVLTSCRLQAAVLVDTLLQREPKPVLDGVQAESAPDPSLTGGNTAYRVNAGRNLAFFVCCHGSFSFLLIHMIVSIQTTHRDLNITRIILTQQI
jgi:hypothetical protein